ncbi:MBL fold metallo-hydrolase [Paenibacillus chitinolyticus]|uniref:MBL fold metallo-hydrolase n=1 Tax=Paenibacillus chitinolyticus TaxID=79263 RepID=UPI0036DE523A
MKLTMHCTGTCKQLEILSLNGGKWRSIAFPGLFAMLEHPSKGLILFDTGYSPRFAEATRRQPYALYRWTTPVETGLHLTAAEHVRAAGYAPEDVTAVVISHFHADHICGLADFPNAKFICSKAGYDSVASLKGLAAVKRAVLPDLIPPDFKDRAIWVEQCPAAALPAACRPFERGWDLFGDGSVAAVDLSGHAAHQIGVFLRGADGNPVLLGADASWSAQAVRENRLPSPPAFILFDSRQDYKRTFGNLVELHRRQPEMRLLFTHCAEAWELCGKEGIELL